eukprot:CAMPEP_0184364678 /NCGR_PEP_ID=MMETSP1089-20130417/145318_1 /TAXON_ID=38269 ORGANISM="Gloeochaete wittrockiana, Strain SAG46.84" /NCGR_SAMPLE_ID=MMETSP1089 /ASSEMBLY_ACC=CAM_ASM_000445 /LENGTH=57 /DNA_ID=CAMNT_0026705645 /DNA_START=33 /DNA_END=207 /DNA_ORIENTATION=+
MAAALRSFSGEDGLILWEVGGDMGDEGLRWEVKVTLEEEGDHRSLGMAEWEVHEALV